MNDTLTPGAMTAWDGADAIEETAGLLTREQEQFIADSEGDELVPFDWVAHVEATYPEGFDPDHRTNGALPEPDGECISEWPEAPDFEPLTRPQFEALVRQVMLLRAERDAIAANSKAMCADLDRQIERVLAENEPQLRHHVDGGYGRKSVRCIYGLAGVRRGGGRLRIVDERLAVESVLELAPSALAVNLDRLPAHFTAPGFDVSPATSKLYVQGLPKSRKAGATEDSDDE